MGLQIEDFSRIVARLHAAAGGPQSWEPVLGDIAECLEATAATVIADTGTARQVLATTIVPEAATAYLDYYARMDFVAKSFEDGPVGLIADGWELGRRHLGSEYYNDWQLRYDMTDGMFVRLAAPVPTSLAISAPPRDEPFATAERVRFLNALVPHLHHALQTRHDLLDPDRSDGLSLDLHAVTDLTKRPVVIVDHRDRILRLNPAAQRVVDARDGLRVRDNRLRVGPSAAVDAHLRALVAAATGARPDQRARVGGHLACPRPSGKAPFVLRIVPLDTERDPRVGRAAIVIVDPTHQPKPPPELLRAMFGLTAAETQVALRLMDGAGLPAIAEDLALSMATIKTHAHNVFAKTRTHRQAHLVRLLATLTP